MSKVSVRDIQYWTQFVRGELIKAMQKAAGGDPFAIEREALGEITQDLIRTIIR